VPVAPEILSKQWSLKKNAFSASDLKKNLYKPYKSYEICNENLEDFARYCVVTEANVFSQ